MKVQIISTPNKEIKVILSLLSFSILFTSFALPQDIGEDKSKIWISGKVIWPGHDTSRAIVNVFTDEGLKNLYATGLIRNPDGIYSLEIEEPGTYYLVAFVDVNNNEKFDTGDGIGMFGVSDWSDPKQKAMPIRLKEGESLSDLNISITAQVDENSSLKPITTTDQQTGISGRVIWPGHDTFQDAMVFVYTDLSWSKRVAQTDVSKDGHYEVNVPPGRYYVVAVVDQNRSNLLDSGDFFGIWGMTRFGAMPKPIIVDQGSIRSQRNIIIVSKISPSGRPVPIEQMQFKEENDVFQKKKITVSGKVIYPGHEVKNAIVQAYSDPSMIAPVAKTRSDDEGRFNLELPEGEYYLTAVIDIDEDDKYSSGDLMGIYGSQDILTQPPKKVVIPDDVKGDINITITGRFDEKGQLKSVENLEESSEVQTEEIDGSKVSGRIIWDGHELVSATLVFSKSQDFQTGVSVPLKLDDQGRYTCSVPEGSYYIMALVDMNDNGRMDAGDGIGLYGTGYLGMGYWGEPQKVLVLNDQTTQYIDITISASLDEHDKPIETPDGIRFHYGDPDTVISEPERQEWWYWSRGLAFTFEKDGEWKLIDKYDFEPKVQPQPFENSHDGRIYFVSDKNIWSIAPDGGQRRWITYGEEISGTNDGSRFIFVNDNNCYLIDGDNIFDLGWGSVAFSPTLSNDGNLVALSRESLIVIKDLETGDESTIPVVGTEVSTINWSYDGRFIAYSSSAASDEPNKDIYYYDRSSGRTHRVTSSTQDDISPAWSPVDQRALVFCRLEGERSQIWIAYLNDDGTAHERQLTKCGGRDPHWSPDGELIVYENNGQIWTIRPDGTDEKPIVKDGRPIFGLRPIWTK